MLKILFSPAENKKSGGNEEKIKSKNSDEHIGDTNSISNEKWSEIKEYQHLHLFLRAVWGFLFNYLTQAIHIKHCKHL